MKARRKPVRRRVNWNDEPRIRAFAASINPAAAKAVRLIRDAWNDHLPEVSETEGLTDKGLISEAISVGLNVLARKHLHDPHVWKADADVWDDAELDDGLYVVPVLRPYPECSDLEREEQRAAVERELARKNANTARKQSTPRIVRPEADGIAAVIELFPRRRAKAAPRRTPVE